MCTVFEYKRGSGAALCETWNGQAFSMTYTDSAGSISLSMYAIADLSLCSSDTPYFSLSADKVIASGRDVLTERLLSEGEPSFDRVKPILPTVENGAYGFFGGAVSVAGIEIDTKTGNLYSQVIYNNNAPTEALFSPAEWDEKLGREKPYLALLNGRLPVVFAVHTGGQEALELLYFVEAGDPDRDPLVWFRAKRYAVSSPEDFTLEYQVVSRSRVIDRHEIAADTFYGALGDTVAFWLRFEKQSARFTLPEKPLERIVSGSQIAAAVTFSGDHPHYGHRYYGKAFHDHFPPNFLWSIEAFCLHDRLPWARRIVDHLFTYVLTDEGRFVYRQGNDELFGASACEYAQLLWLLRRYADRLALPAAYAEQLRGIGEYLLSHLRPCPEADGEALIYMCAEADSNTRVHAYINNNLWCVHGLRALADLLKRFGKEGELYRTQADRLYRTVLRLIQRQGIHDDRFGALPPFRVGYTAAPQTLSACRDTFSPMTDKEYAEYARWIDMREQGDAAQEYTENNYANYRYYPEMLGTMLLPKPYADGVKALRENLGGELLCMTRFLRHLDDWPVLHYARFLLENGYIDKYLTLLYAHACHHGRSDLMCYYEQVSPVGKVHAEDCIPSLLTVPTMVAWQFAYETMDDDRVLLLAGIPKAWYAEGFAVKGLGTSFGTVDIAADAQYVTIAFSQVPAKSVSLILRHRDAVQVIDGAEYVSSQEGNTLTLKAGVSHVRLKLVK